MSIVSKVLVIGGGIAGMCAAIELRKSGIGVDLIEVDPQWRVYGAGISISGATLRAFKQIGVIDEIMAQGACTDGMNICLADGTVINQLPTRRLAGPDIPSAGGIMRPVLARILSRATIAGGAQVRLGVDFESIMQQGETVCVRFSDGTVGEYDLVIGADGVHSKTRAQIFPSAPAPAYTGQGSWRAVVPRPSSVQCPSIFMGRTTKAGLNPVSSDEMYLFVLQSLPENEFIDPIDWPQRLKSLLGEFGGVVGDIRDSLNEQSRIVYRPLQKLLMSAPWHAGRVVLIGDAVHATTPHLASGAGISVEDAIVLAEELALAPDVASALTRFVERRFERCRTVVENSVRLGDIENQGGLAAKDQHAALMMQTMLTLQEPI